MKLSTVTKLLSWIDVYISKACLRPIYNKSDKINMIVDMKLNERIQTELIKGILKFEL